MHTFTVSHLTDSTLLSGLSALVARDRQTTAELLAHLAEVDERGLYRPAAYPSMFEYCVGHLGFSEDSAAKRIQAARAARRHPELLAAIADGRLHLSAVVLLAPRLNEQNAAELIAAAAHRSRAQVQRLLADREPRPDVPARVAEITSDSPAGPSPEHAPGHVDSTSGPALELADSHAPGHVNSAAGWNRGRVDPLGDKRFALQVTIGQATHDQLRKAQDLLGASVAPGDLAEVLDRALALLVKNLERRKCGAASRPGRPHSPRRSSPRAIPAAIRRAVWERDGGRCTFESESGHRCEATRGLEFDHIVPVGRGGTSSVSNLRLRCRAHNQFEAERTYGAGFMDEKRRAAKRARPGARPSDAAAPSACAAATQADVPPATHANPPVETKADQPPASRINLPPASPASGAAELIPWLRRLGYRADEAREAAAFGSELPGAPLEARVRRALAYFRPRVTLPRAPAVAP